jgi:glutamine synthetase
LEAVRGAKEAGIKATAITRIAKQLVEMVDELEDALEDLRAQNAELGGDEVSSKVVHMRDRVIPAMGRVRNVVDRLEKVIPDDLWPIPIYRDMLHLR